MLDSTCLYCRISLPEKKLMLTDAGSCQDQVLGLHFLICGAVRLDISVILSSPLSLTFAYPPKPEIQSSSFCLERRRGWGWGEKERERIGSQHELPLLTATLHSSL
jgi:hypothetical protein